MGKKLEIVIVDDEIMITDLIQSFIQFSVKDANVHSFDDAVDAYDFITNNDIDVLITDYNMPRINGLQLMEATKPTTMRIMISGYVSDIAEEKLHSLDAIFFEKPVPMKELGSLISQRANAS
ncbi:MAG: response regulator [Fibrobacterota bacterium]